MSIKFPPKVRTVLLCDYSLGGFREPEMIKRRPAVVLAPQLPRRPGLCTVVPLSGSEPLHSVPYVVRLALAQPLPEPFAQTIWWAKCDMVASVSIERLDLFRTQRDQFGKRKYLEPKLSEDDFARVRHGVLNGLGFVGLTLKSEQPS